jgi:preprotein translocase subunit SecE
MKTQNRVQDFFGEVFAEMRRITWPTRKEAVSYTITVIVFIVLTSAFLGGSDLIIQALLDKIILSK